MKGFSVKENYIGKRDPLVQTDRKIDKHFVTFIKGIIFQESKAMTYKLQNYPF